MPEIRFIERRDKVEVIERLGPFERGSSLFWHEYTAQMQIASMHNRSRTPNVMSFQMVYILDGNQHEIKSHAEI